MGTKYVYDGLSFIIRKKSAHFVIWWLSEHEVLKSYHLSLVQTCINLLLMWRFYEQETVHDISFDFYSKSYKGNTRMVKNNDFTYSFARRSISSLFHFTHTLYIYIAFFSLSVYRQQRTKKLHFHRNTRQNTDHFTTRVTSLLTSSKSLLWRNKKTSVDINRSMWFYWESSWENHMILL
jgi:hypothetical protein